MTRVRTAPSDRIVEVRMTPGRTPDRSRSKMFRRAAVTLLCLAAAAGAVVATRAALDRLESDAPAVAVESDTNIATADIRDLTETYTATGTLQFDASIDVAAPVAGTVLSVVDAGSTLANGDVIASIDDRVVVWLEGEVPAWRALTTGDEGVDVVQLETALTALGFNGDGDVTVDQEYTSATAAMVEAWQEALGVDATGRVDLGTVVFGGARTRVAATSVGAGDVVNDGAPLIAIGTTTRYALLDAAPSEAVTLQLGDTASIELPDRSTIDGTVLSIASGSDSWQVGVGFDDSAEFPATDVTTVEMSWNHDLATGVLTVPSSSLLRVDDGGYVIAVVGDDGTTSTTPVIVGVAVGTRVQILDGIADGTQVIAL